MGNGSVAKGETNTEPSNSSQIVTQSSGAEAVGSNLLETGFNQKIEDNDEVKISDISPLNSEEIKLIIKNLDGNHSVKLALSPDNHRKRNYSEIIIKPLKKSSLGIISYKVSTVSVLDKKKDYEDVSVDITPESNSLKIRLSYRNWKRTINKKKYIFFLTLNGFDLHILTSRYTEKIEIEETVDHSQEISYLNQKYNTNFVSIIDNIGVTNEEQISDLIERLKDHQRLVFINNIPPLSTKIEAREIEVIYNHSTSRTKYYDIYTDKSIEFQKESPENNKEGFVNYTMSIEPLRGLINMVLKRVSEGKRYRKSLSITNFQLFSSANAK